MKSDDQLKTMASYTIYNIWNPQISCGKCQEKNSLYKQVDFSPLADFKGGRGDQRPQNSHIIPNPNLYNHTQRTHTLPL